MRKGIFLKDDLLAIDGTLIAKRGTKFTQELADGVVVNSHGLRNEPFWQKPYSLDFESILSEQSYRIILESAENTGFITSTIKAIRVSSCILEELASMKRKDYYTYRHVFMTCALTITVARALDKSHPEILRLAHSALTHDLGKMRIPQDILQSTKKLSRSKYEYIYLHPVFGYLLLLHYYGDSQPLSPEVELKHHEYIDGSGYPMGLEQKDEGIGIITANDIFDALISPRSYRSEPYNTRGALDHLWDMVGKGQVFENPAKCLIALNRREKPNWKKITIHKMKKGLVPTESNYGPSDED